MADGRAWLAQAGRFPGAEARRCVLIDDAANLDQLGLNHRDVVALLTHSFEQDKTLLRKLLPLELRYFGLLGARHRSWLLLTGLAPATWLDGGRMPAPRCMRRLGWTWEETARRRSG